MKRVRNLFASSRFQHSGLACACILTLSAGGAVRIAVDRISAIHDEMESDLNRPSQEFLRYIAQRLKTNDLKTEPGEPQRRVPVSGTREIVLP